MSAEPRKPSLLWALAAFAIPVFVILYGTVFVAVRPPVLPLIAATAIAALMALPLGYRWKDLQEGIFEALGRIQLAVLILVFVGMLIGTWILSGTIPMIIYWGLNLISPEGFLLTTFLLCAVSSTATGTSFGTMGTMGVALLGVGQALGYPLPMIVGAVVSGAYFGDKMSPVSDSTNITATICEVNLFSHIGSMLWTTVPAAVVAGIAYYVMGAAFAEGNAVPVDQVNTILAALEANFSLSWWSLLPPVLLIVLAYRKLPTVPVMAVCILVAVVLAAVEGHGMKEVADVMTRGYKSATGVAQLDKLISRGGIMSVLPTIILLISGVAFGGVLERMGALEVIINAVLRWANSGVRLVFAGLVSTYIILLGTGSQLLAAIIPGRAFAPAFRTKDIHLRVLSRTCEDGGTLGCPLVPWSVHAFYILGVLGVSAFEFAPYAILNWMVPVFSLILASTGFGMWRTDGSPFRAKRSSASAAESAAESR